MDITEDHLVELFLQNRDLAEKTRIRYLHAIKIYSEFINETPTQWIEEAENEEEDRIRMRKRKIKTYQLDFKKFLESKNYTTWTIKSMIIPIRIFYKEYDIEIPDLKIKNTTPEETYDDIPSKEDIRLALQFANLKYRAIILLFSSSGMGVAELLSIKYHDLLNSLKEYITIPQNTYIDIEELIHLIKVQKEKNPIIIPTWQLTRKKTRKPFISFSTPESLDILLEYLKSDPPQKLETPLIRGYDPNKPLNRRALFKHLERINDKCEFGKPHRQIKIRSHAIGRKYFTNVLYHNGLQQLSIDFFLAHTIDKTTSAYFKNDIESLKNQYITCIDDLSIEDTEVRILESEDKKLLNELQAKNVEKDLELEDTKKRLKRLELYMEQKERTDNLKKPDED